MRLSRTASLALCLGVAFLMLAGSALAGTTTATTRSYARELGAVNTDYTIPGGTTLTRSMAVIRSDVQDFFVDVTLLNGATFRTGDLPVAADVTVTGGAGAFSVALISGGTNGSSTVRFFVDITTSMTALGSVAIDAGGWLIRDVTNVLGPGGTISVTITTSDSATNVLFDGGTDTTAWLAGAFATGAGPIVATTAVVDVATNRRNFVVVAGGDTLTTDVGATLAIKRTTSSVLNAAGTTYGLSAGSNITLTLAGDLSGIASWSYGGNSDTVTSGEVTAGSTVLTLAGTAAAFDNTGQAIIITVNGTTVLTSRTLTVAVGLSLGASVDGPSANNRTLLSASTVTVWTLNGTILVANWSNGNSAVFSSRFYLWNPSPVAGNVTARVYTLPLMGGANAQVGSTVILGSLVGMSGVNIRLAEDILTPGGVTLPYVTNGGNLVVELTIEANNVNGYSQTFSSTAFMGVATLNRVQ